MRNPPNSSTPLLHSIDEGTPSMDSDRDPREEICQSQSKGESDSSSSPGLGDAYETWSDSSDVIHQAFFHTIVYMSLGVVGYSFLLDTQWSIIDSLYFSVVIFTTVGYGDLCPNSSAAGMIFTLFFALYGIVILGIFLGILGEMAVERQQKLKNEVLEHTRKSYITSIISNSVRPSLRQSFSSIIPVGEIEEEIEEEIEHGCSFLADVFNIAREQTPNIITLAVLGSPIMMLENWSIIRSVYWLVVTGTTIGLGDEHPESDWSKVMCIFYIPAVVAFAGTMLGRIATFYVDQRNDKMEAEFFARALSVSDIKKMDLDGDSEVTKYEFLVFMLTTLQKVEQSDIDEIFDLFHHLDKTNNGILTADDIAYISDRTSVLQRESDASLIKKNLAKFQYPDIGESLRSTVGFGQSTRSKTDVGQSLRSTS